MEPELVFLDVTVVDGSGAPPYQADVAVSGGRVVHIGKYPGRADRVIRGSGLVLAPGFIDAHGHSDDTLLVDPRGESKIRQGITTEVIGNCGFSMAPLAGDGVDAVQEEIASLNLRVEWRSMREYLACLARRGMGLNIIPLVGHGTIRKSVLGFSDRAPGARELAEMCRLADEAMGDGAFGLSTGLIYPPACFAKTEEVTALSRVVKARGGIYTTHLRDEGDDLEEAVLEALSVGRDAGIPVHLSHHKASGPSNWGKVHRTAGLMADARTGGQDVTCDFYPYTAVSTNLASLLPQKVHAGGPEAAKARLQDLAQREEIKGKVTAEVEIDGGWEKVVVRGQSLEQIARAKGVSPAEQFCLLLEEDWHCPMVRYLMAEGDVEKVMTLPWSMVGTDASSRSPEGVLGQSHPHPRAYGTFPRILGRYVREKGLLSLEQAVHKMTGLTAARFGLPDRGFIRQGMWADLVLFDPAAIIDDATYEQPHRFPRGLQLVMVNGEIVAEEGVTAGLLPGKVLIRRKDFIVKKRKF